MRRENLLPEVACYHTGYTETFSAPELLPAAVDRAFDNLFSIGEAG